MYRSLVCPCHSLLLVSRHRAQHPAVTKNSGQAWRSVRGSLAASLVGFVLFWCIEPCGHMAQTQTAVQLYHALTLAHPRHAGRSTWVRRQGRAAHTKQAVLARQRHQWTCWQSLQHLIVLSSCCWAGFLFTPYPWCYHRKMFAHFNRH